MRPYRHPDGIRGSRQLPGAAAHAPRRLHPEDADPRQWLRVGLAVLVAVAGACTIGPRVEEFPPARSPVGVVADIQTREARRLSGELLVVEDSALLILSARTTRVTRVPYRTIRRAEFRQLSWATIRDGKPPDRGKRSRLALVSRFPQGLSPELLARFMEARGQEEVETVER